MVCTSGTPRHRPLSKYGRPDGPPGKLQTTSVAQRCLWHEFLWWSRCAPVVADLFVESSYSSWKLQADTKWESSGPYCAEVAVSLSTFARMGATEHLAIHLQTARRGAAGRQSCLAFTAAEFNCSAIGMMTFHYNEVAVSIYVRHMQSGALDAICAYKRHMRHAPQQTEGHPASIYLQVQFSKCGCTLTSRPSLSHRTTPNHEDCLRCKCPIGASVLQQHQTFSLRMSCDQANNQIVTNLASARLIETRPDSLTLGKLVNSQNEKENARIWVHAAQYSCLRQRQVAHQVLGQASKVSIHCFEWQGLSNCSGEDTSAGANTEACYALLCMHVQCTSPRVHHCVEDLAPARMGELSP